MKLYNLYRFDSLILGPVSMEEVERKICRLGWGRELQNGTLSSAGFNIYEESSAMNWNKYRLNDEKWEKVYQVGTLETSGGRRYTVYVKAEYSNGCLSISGVEGPLRSGNCLGGCGQIGETLISSDLIPGPSWDHASLKSLYGIWETYHLNDMQAGCEHQREYRNKKWEIGEKCGVCDYKYGHEWKFMDVPNDVLDRLESFPETDRKPAWI